MRSKKLAFDMISAFSGNTSLIKQKSSILGLAQTNTAEYASKLNGLTSGLQSKLILY
jgi:hypothetical protein